jgi:branched-chain amino acid transport system substrate-binding protein
MRKIDLTRRKALGMIGAAAGLPLITTIAPARADAGVPIGTLCSLTGAGSTVGGPMERAVRRQIELVNAAGGAGGRSLSGFYENSESDPNAAVLGAKKLITVDGVSAILGDFMTSTTLAVSPLCIANKVVQFTSAGDDKITDQDHGGLIFRTEAGSSLWGRTFAEAAWNAGVRRAVASAVQAPFALAYTQSFVRYFKELGGTIVADPVIYAAQATSYRGELQQLLSKDPELVFVMGYTPDTVILIKEAFQAGSDARWLVPGYVGLDPELVKAMGSEAASGVLTIDPSPDQSSEAWKKFVTLMKGDEGGITYAAQTFDQATLVALAIAKTGKADGPGISEGIRQVTAAGGSVVTSFEEGAAALKQGNTIKYSGLSSPCDFDKKGNITSARFTFYKFEDGKPEATGAKMMTV